MWSIIKSHFHKGKIGFIITGLFVTLSVLMMIVGLSICFGMGDLYLNARNLSNSPDMSIFVYEKKGGALSTRIIDSVMQRDDIDLLDSQTFYYLEMPKDDENYFCSFIFNEHSDMAFKGLGVYNIEDKNNKFKPYVRDEVAGEGYKFYVSGNYLINGHLGDKVVFRFNGENHFGYVAGVFDDMCKIYSTNYFYVDNAFFNLVVEYGKKDEYKDIVLEENTINIRTKHVEEKSSVQAFDSIGKLVGDITRQYNIEQFPITQKIIQCGYADRQIFKEGTSPFILILGAALTAFAVIVAVIVAIVIGFLVRSSVMDEVRNLGILKSLGYTTNMLRLSYLAIYAIISIVCMVVGIALGIGLMPNFVHIITNMARLDCSKAIGLNVGSVFIAISMLAIIIVGVVMLATNRVKRVTTLSAMRNNLETHSFKRNHIPLEKSKVPVNVSLGSKSVVGEVNRSVMVVVVVLIMSLLCSFISVVYYNLKVDQTALIEMSAMENPDYIIGLRYADNKPYFDALRAMDSYEYDMLEVDIGCNIDDEWHRGIFYQNFEILRTKVVYKGRYPKYTNEILINDKFAKQKGYEIGDTITVKLEYKNNKFEKDCVIVGCFQSLFENCDFMAFYSLFEADIDEDTNFWQRYFYFKQGQTPTYDDITNVLRSVNNESNIQYGGFMSGMDRLRSTILTQVETAADAVMSVFMSVTAIIISLLLVMLIKLKLLRERRNYAVYKALGYTTKDIMTQIAIAMVILGVVGSIVGSIIGALITSPMLSLMGSMIGAGHFAFIIPWGYVVGIFFGVPILIYLISMLCSVPVKNIAPATLLRERG